MNMNTQTQIQQTQAQIQQIHKQLRSANSNSERAQLREKSKTLNIWLARLRGVQAK